jgi:hypothetical protein
MVQIRAIALKKERFDRSDIHETAAGCFWSVKPMLEALRSGDMKKMEAYGDISPVNMEDYYMAYLAMLPPYNDIPQKRDGRTLSEKAVLQLLGLGVEPTLAKRLVGNVMAEHIELKKAADVVRLAYQRFVLTTESADQPVSGDEQDGDLRTADGYADMKSAEIIEEKEW